MKFSKKSVCFFCLFVLYVTPHFPYYSYGIARVIDFASLAIMLIFAVFLNWKYQVKLTQTSSIYLTLLGFNLLFILLGNINGVNGEYSSLRDVADLYRPIWWGASFFIGVGFAHDNVDTKTILKFILLIAFFSFLVAVLEKLGFTFLYKIYSGGLHIVSNRATGIAQDFGDYSFIQAIGSAVALICYLNYQQKKYLFISILLLVSILLSTSKAGLGLLVSCGTLLLVLVTFRKKTQHVYKVVFISFISFVVFVGLHLVFENPKFLGEVESLLSGDVNLPSIKNRLDDFYYVKEIIFDDITMATFIGVGANKGLTAAYIEVAILSNIYRTGIAGVIFYYMIFVHMICVLIKRKYFPLAFLVLFALGIDLFAAMTNRLISVSLLMILFGYISYEGVVSLDRNMVRKKSRRNSG